MKNCNSLSNSEQLECDVHGPYNLSEGGSLGCPQCIKEKQEKRNANIRKYQLKVSGVPVRFHGKGFDDYKTGQHTSQSKILSTCKKYAHDFGQAKTNGRCMVLCGRPGTGKTHLACAIGQHILKQVPTDKVDYSFGTAPSSAKYISAASAIRRVRETYRKDSNSTEEEILDSFLTPRLLILDEIGVQYGTEAEKIILFEVIDRRYAAEKPTIIISNLPVEELNKYIGERAMDRLKEGGGLFLPFPWESYRQ